MQVLGMLPAESVGFQVQLWNDTGWKARASLVFSVARAHSVWHVLVLIQCLVFSVSYRVHPTV